MSAQLQPIKVFGKGGPNPPKIAFILEELGLPYEVIPVPMSDIKKPEYTAINPNGRLPSIQDPNKDITLWESGAIVEYLIEVYDKERKLSFAAGSPESFHTKQWLFYQTSGQGPYYGQAAWFKKFHHETLPSAAERYIKEINRVTAVLEEWLVQEKEKYGGAGDGPWLVANKLSYADIAFVQWQTIIPLMTTKDEYDVDNFPEVKGWIVKMTARKAIAKVLAEQSGPLS